MLNIGKNISRLRKARGLTQAELAKIIKRDRTIITKYESGDIEISAEMALHLARALKVPIAKIVEDTAKSA